MAMGALEALPKGALPKVTGVRHAVPQPLPQERPRDAAAPLTSWGTSSPKSASIRNILAIFSQGPCRILAISGYSQSFNFVRSEKECGRQNSWGGRTVSLCSRMGMGWKTDVQGPWHCCQMLCDGHCLDVDCVLQRRPSSERNSGWRSTAREVDLGRPGHAALDRGLFPVGEGLLIHPENPDAQSSPPLTEPPGESGSPRGPGGIPKGMTSVPGYKPGRGARGGGTACPKTRRAPALCPLPKPAQPSEKELSWQACQMDGDLSQRQTLTPRLMNDVECKLTGAVFHLHR